MISLGDGREQTFLNIFNRRFLFNQGNDFKHKST